MYAVEDSSSEGIAIEREMIVQRSASGCRALFPVSSVALLGRHLLSDVLAAAAVGVVAGVAPNAMQRAVESFRGLEHTLEEVCEIAGVRFINDSKATNVAAARAAIECFDFGTVVIMGGQFKGGDLSAIAAVLRPRVDAVVTVGEAQARLREALGLVVPLYEVDTMKDAVRQAFAKARPGGTVLLAPACASFDMFSSYVERGEMFKAEVERLAMEHTMG